jgi:DNA-binding IclR family transcriptional regulator
LESSLYGVSAPVLDRTGRPLAVLSIWGPRDRVSQQTFTELGPIAVAAAQEVGTSRPGLPGAPPVVA